MNISSLFSSLAVQGTTSYATTRTSSTNSTSSVATDSTSDVSDLAKLMKQLKELASSDPEQFKQVTSKIADKLEEAASSAAESGDSRQAEMLNDLASKFKTASETGEMPDLRPPGPPPARAQTEGDADSTSLTSRYGELMKLFEQNSGTDPMSVLQGILQDSLSTTAS